MTTAVYIVAYPHPSVRPLDRCCPCRVDSQTFRVDILKQLYQEYPKSIEDLQLATLWKASDLDKEDVYDESTRKVYDWINRQDDKAEIPRSDPIVELFPDGPHDRSFGKVDIVVVTPEILEVAHGDVVGLGYIKAREETIKAIAGCSAPSDCVKNPANIRGALNVPHGPRCGRPSDRFGPPTALFSKPLARLKHELDNLHLLHPDPVTLEHAFALVDISAKFFVDESTREEALKHTLESLLPGGPKWQESTANKSAKPDGSWFEDIFVYLITEIKNEPGLGGDPFLQGVITYGKITAQKAYASYLKRSNLPIILLAIAGNRLTVSTAILTNEIHVDELLSMTLRIGSHGSEHVTRVARVFIAIRKSMGLLRKLYSSLSPDVDKSKLPQTIALWPDPTTDPSRRIPKLEYFAKVNRINGTQLSHIDEMNERHGMYLARMRIETQTQADASTKTPSQPGSSTETPSQPGPSTETPSPSQLEGPTQIVFVKFAVQYNEAAHILLAEQDPPLAPALYFCARVVGNMYMVIMEYIPESRGWSIDRVPQSSPLRQKLPELVERDVSKALSLLHAKDLVFGDLREPNILCLPDSDGGRVLLVDFDTVGDDGKSRYSALLNPLALYCNDVQKGQIMKKEHDSEQLEDILRRLAEP